VHELENVISCLDLVLSLIDKVPFQVFVARILGWIWPQFPVGKLDDSFFSRDKEVVNIAWVLCYLAMVLFMVRLEPISSLDCRLEADSSHLNTVLLFC
jgi:hypothetical protein